MDRKLEFGDRRVLKLDTREKKEEWVMRNVGWPIRRGSGDGDRGPSLSGTEDVTGMISTWQAWREDGLQGCVIMGE